MINPKIALFITGATIGAVTTMASLLVAGKIMDDATEAHHEETMTKEREFFVNCVRDYLVAHNNENVEMYIHSIEDLCKYFTVDYRKFFVSLYDFVLHDEYDSLVNYLDSIHRVNVCYTATRWMDHDKLIESIINGDNVEQIETTESEEVEISEDVTEAVEA